MGARGLGFSYKLTRKVLGTRPGAGGTFYWIRETVADPDIGPQGGARFATDLLKMPFKPPRASADEVLFEDAENVYFKARVEPGFKSPDEFEKQCATFEADKEPNRLRSNVLLPQKPERGAKWESVASKFRLTAKGRWTTEALRRDWLDTVTVEEDSPGRTQKTYFAANVGPVGWFQQTAKGKSYFEVAESRLGAEERPPELSPELTEMRLRGILGPDQDRFGADDTRLLGEMRQAERERGVEFLKTKTGTLRPYVVERKTPDGGLEVWFNTRGFELFRFLLSQEAIQEFERLGIQLKYIFYIVDAGERPVFDEEGLLTDDGEAVVYAMRRGDRAVWKLPGQDVKPSGVQGDDPKVMALLAKGYEEASAEELQYVMDITKCSKAQLEERYTLKTVPDALQKRVRYFFHKDDELTTYLGLHRAGGDLKKKLPGGLLGVGTALCE